jgi:CHAD domain-containing protein
VIEVERKFVLGEDAELTGFETLAPSLRVGSVETVDLDALYYDTADFRLARSGAALRMRLGGTDAGWHLKLPGTEPDARIELRRPASLVGAASWVLDPPSVPEELVDLTLARTGGLPLRPVVRLTTRRTRTVLVGPESQPLAEVDEDEVGAFFDEGAEAHDRWKELEIELLEGTPGELDRISQELERSGGRPAEYPSKFVRAIGPAASRPFISEPRGTKKSKNTVGWVFSKRWHDLVVELVARDVGVRLGDGESVHKMRVAIRRLRSTLRTFTPVLDKASARWLRDELGWLGGVLGPVRDADVLRGHLENLVDSLPAAEVLGPVRDEIASHFAEARQKALADALEAMRSERYLSLLDVLRAVSLAPPTRPKAELSINKGAPWLLRRDLERVALRVEAADGIEDWAERARALHEVRKAAKGMRYAGETFQPVLGKPAARIARRFEAIHEMLGSGQDAVTARSLLHELGARTGGRAGHNGYTYGLLAGLEEKRFDHAAAELPDLWRAASSAKLWDSLER